jgi:hypothetical protein
MNLNISESINNVLTSTPRLRSTIAQSLIKKLFVKNIPKDFSFDDYENSECKKPVDQLNFSIVKKKKKHNISSPELRDCKTPKKMTSETKKMMEKIFEKSVKKEFNKKCLRL